MTQPCHARPDQRRHGRSRKSRRRRHVIASTAERFTSVIEGASIPRSKTCSCRLRLFLRQHGDRLTPSPAASTRSSTACSPGEDVRGRRTTPPRARRLHAQRFPASSRALFSPSSSMHRQDLRICAAVDGHRPSLLQHPLRLCASLSLLMAFREASGCA